MHEALTDYVNIPLINKRPRDRRLLVCVESVRYDGPLEMDVLCIGSNCAYQSSCPHLHSPWSPWYIHVVTIVTSSSHHRCVMSMYSNCAVTRTHTRTRVMWTFICSAYNRKHRSHIVTLSIVTILTKQCGKL